MSSWNMVHPDLPVPKKEQQSLQHITQTVYKYQQSQKNVQWNSHSKVAVQAHKTLYRRHCLVTIFLSFHFPTMALYVYCDKSQNLTPPPHPGTQNPQVAPKIYPSMDHSHGTLRLLMGSRGNATASCSST